MLPRKGDPKITERHPEKIITVIVKLRVKPIDPRLQPCVGLIWNFQRIQRTGLMPVLPKNAGVYILRNKSRRPGIMQTSPGKAVKYGKR